VFRILPRRQSNPRLFDVHCLTRGSFAAPTTPLASCVMSRREQIPGCTGYVPGTRTRQPDPSID